MEKKMYVWVHATSPTLKVEGEKKLCQFAFCVRLTTEEPQCTWSKKISVANTLLKDQDDWYELLKDAFLMIHTLIIATLAMCWRRRKREKRKPVWQILPVEIRDG